MNSSSSNESRAPDTSAIAAVTESANRITISTAPRDASAWLVPLGLLLLSFMPIAGGLFRLTQLAVGAQVTPANARFFASPVPVVLHIVSVTVFSLLGAFQFDRGLRQHRPALHRFSGRVLIPSGLLAALSGLWLTLLYPWPAGDGEILFGLRLLFGSLMVLSILVGITAIWRRDFVQHGHFMMRGYAIGLGAGTQALTQMAWFLLVGKPDETAKALLMGTGWLINLAVVEFIIRKGPARSGGKAAVFVSSLH